MLHPESRSAKAVFLDKDGTLVRDIPYNVDPDLIMFETGVFEGLRLLQRAGYKLAIISNQPGLAMGLFSQEQIENLVRYFETSFMVNGLELSGFYYCPHLASVAERPCFCCKPEPGLLF